MTLPGGALSHLKKNPSGEFYSPQESQIALLPANISGMRAQVIKPHGGSRIPRVCFQREEVGASNPPLHGLTLVSNN